MISIPSIAQIYDFSLIEKAVQKFYVATEYFCAPLDDDDPNREIWTPGDGLIPIYTAFQAATFQKCRPRIAIGLNNISPTQWPPRTIIDADNNMRNEWWAAALQLMVVTDANYARHVQLRSYVAAIAAIMAAPTTNTEPGGLNLYLQYHTATDCRENANSTTVHAEEGNYHSVLNYHLTFAVLPNAWPGGTQ